MNKTKKEIAYAIGQYKGMQRDDRKSIRYYQRQIECADRLIKEHKIELAKYMKIFKFDVTYVQEAGGFDRLYFTCPICLTEKVNISEIKKACIKIFNCIDSVSLIFECGCCKSEFETMKGFKIKLIKRGKIN